MLSNTLLVMPYLDREGLVTSPLPLLVGLRPVKERDLCWEHEELTLL